MPVKYTWKCATCDKQKQNKDPAVKCTLCKELVGLECTDYDQDVLELFKEKNIEAPFLCKPCTEKLPSLRNMLDITQQQQKMKEDIEAHDTRITTCEVDTGELKEKQKADNTLLNEINIRLGELEAKSISAETVKTIATKFFKDSDFPDIKDAVNNQAETNKKFQRTFDSQKEQNLRSEKETSLIVFGIPEEETTKEAQMKSDFLTIKNLYEHRVPLECTDLSQIMRIGTVDPDKIKTRPIKITFRCIQKKLSILRNNRDLIILSMVMSSRNAPLTTVMARNIGTSSSTPTRPRNK